VIIAMAASHRNPDVVLTSALPPRIADLESHATSPAWAILVAPPSVEPPQTKLAQAVPPKTDTQSRERGALSASPQVPQTSQPQSTDSIQPAAKTESLTATGTPAPIPPPAAPAAQTPEQVLITGNLIRGSAAVGVPLFSLGQAQYGADSLNASPQNTEHYPNATPNAVKVVSADPVSTFSVDVDTASYANVRRYLNQSVLPPIDAVRIEEMVNYFDYSYAVPRDRAAPFQPTVAVYPSPWNKDTQILHIGIKGFDLPKTERPRANLVFLIDTSGSMNMSNKLPLLKRSFQLLVNQLRPEDRVSIVVYAGAAGTVLEPTPGSDKAKILAAIDRMQAGGSTAGGEGIRQAYELAKANFDKTGVNRVLLATDGDFNVGITDPKALEDFIARERSSGVFLTVLGFGVDNYNDLMMQKLSQAGNGVAAYIDTINEARKVFVDEIGSTLFTIAKDVKIQVEFNPARVAEYRLIGYETRMLNRTDFNNDKVDAGDIGSGHTVTALYEITPVGSKVRAADPLRYGSKAPTANVTSPQTEIAFLKIRYKLPNEDESKLITRPIVQRDVEPDFNKLPIDIRFAAAVAGSAQLLRHDPYIKSFDYSQAIALAQGAKGDDEFGYRNEFVQLLRMAQTAASLQPLDRARPSVRQ
jgi:Ca-activated chloride channel family protein